MRPQPALLPSVKQPRRRGTERRDLGPRTAFGRRITDDSGKMSVGKARQHSFFRCRWLCHTPGVAGRRGPGSQPLGLCAFYEAAVASQAPHLCRCQSHDADEAMGRSRAAFYSRFQVSVCPPRIMSFASAGGAISVTTRQESQHRTRSPAGSWLRQSGRGGYALAKVRASNVVSSRHSANKMRLRRRANATTAMRLPRRAAIPSTHAFRVPLPGCRQHTQAA